MPHVLVVDDEASLRRLFCRVIEREGVSSARPKARRAALPLASDDPSQVAFCDAVVTGVRAGSRVYLIKPISPDDLRKTLKASLEEHAIRVRDGISTRIAPLP